MNKEGIVNSILSWSDGNKIRQNPCPLYGVISRTDGKHKFITSRLFDFFLFCNPAEVNQEDDNSCLLVIRRNVLTGKCSGKHKLQRRPVCWLSCDTKHLLEV